MIHQVGNDVVNSLVCNQVEMAPKLVKMHLLYKLGSSYYYVGFKSHGLHPFGSIISCHQYIFVVCISPHGVDGTNKIQPPFCKWVWWQCGDQLCHANIGYISYFSHSSKDLQNIMVFLWKMGHQHMHFPQNNVYKRKTTTHSFVQLNEDNNYLLWI